MAHVRPLQQLGAPTAKRARELERERRRDRHDHAFGMHVERRGMHAHAAGDRGQPEHRHFQQHTSAKSLGNPLRHEL